MNVDRGPLGRRARRAAKTGIGDAEAVKAVLAVMSSDRELDGAARRRRAERPARPRARCDEASSGRVVTVQAAEVIARITAQACRQAGLSLVWRDLLDFEGDEIYFQPVPELAGHTFGEALLAFETSTRHRAPRRRRDDHGAPADGHAVRGRRRGRSPIAEDDDTVVFTGFRDEDAPDVVLTSPAPDRTGPSSCSSSGGTTSGRSSSASSTSSCRRGRRSTCSPTPTWSSAELDRPAARNLRDDASGRPHGNLDRLTERSSAEHSYDKVIVLGYRSGLSPDGGRRPHAAHAAAAAAGARRRRRTAGDRRIVTELLDSRDVELARATGADDFVVSDELSSLMLAQLAERRRPRARLRRPVRRRGLGDRAPAGVVVRRRRPGAVRDGGRGGAGPGRDRDRLPHRAGRRRPARRRAEPAQVRRRSTLGQRRPGRRDRAGLTPCSSDVPRPPSGDVLQAAWERSPSGVGAIRPGSRRARGSARSAHDSVICFPVAALFGER